MNPALRFHPGLIEGRYFARIAIAAFTGLALALGAAVTVVLGIIPQPLLSLANHAATQLFVR